MEPWMGELMDISRCSPVAGGGQLGPCRTNDLLRNRIKIRSLNFIAGRTFLNRFLILDEARTSPQADERR